MTEEKKSMVPKLRFPGFNETWEQRELSSLSELITKGTSPLGNGNDGDINFIKVENLDSFSGKILSCSKVSKEEHLTYLRRSILYKGDILFSIAGTLGRTAIVPEDILPANTNQALAIIRTKNQDPRFLFTALKSRTVTDFIKKNPTVGAQPNLSLAQVGSLKIPYPSRAEQEKIGEFFSQLDTTITLHQRKLEGLSKLKKSLLQKMFPKNGQQNPEVRFPGFTEAWEQRKLKDFTLSYSGGTPSVSNKNYYNGTIPFIRSGEISGERTELFITEEGLNKSSAKRVHKGQILYALYGATSGEVSLSKIDGAINQAILAISTKEGYSNAFLSFWLRKEKDRITATFLQGGQGNLSGEIVKNLIVPVPSQLEQTKIGDLFNQLDGIITLHQRKLESLKILKKSLLQQMFV